MTNEKPMGYKEKSSEFLENNKVSAWDEVKIIQGNKKFEGILLPRNKFAQECYGYLYRFLLEDDTRSWPWAKIDDYLVMTRMVRRIYEIIETLD